MEIEVKLRLPNKEARDKIHELLANEYETTHDQENYFFDGPDKELSSNRVVTRLRFYNKDQKALITVKGKTVLQDGVGRSTEVEGTVPPAEGRKYLEQPDHLLDCGLDFITNLKSTFNLTSLICLGGFENERKVYKWKGLTLEVDHTKYEWGSTYEVECETTEPEQTRAKLEELLSGAGISYTYNTSTKFANFVHRTLE